MRGAPPHPLASWEDCLARAGVLAVLGSSMLAGEASVEGLPGVTVVHPRGVAELRVNGGGLYAWEPLEPPTPECPGRPLNPGVDEAGFPGVNPTPRAMDLALPGQAGGPLVARARPLSRVESAKPAGPQASLGRATLGSGAMLEGSWGSCRRLHGWLVCDAAAVRPGGIAVVSGEARVSVDCFSYRVEVLHPAGFARVEGGEAYGLAVTASCPRSSLYFASHRGVRVEAGPGRVRVESDLAVIAPGGGVDAVYALAHLAPPRLEGQPPAHIRCARAACLAAGTGPLKVAAWTPTWQDGEVEVLARFRAARAVLWDPAGRVEAPADGGVVRMPLPGLTWAVLMVEKGPEFLERLRAARRGP